MNAFASAAQYIERYGVVPDKAMLEEVLKDASREIASELDRAGIAYADPDECFADRLMQVCRSIAHRANGSSSSDIPAGATQYSQGAVGITESYTLGNPYGEVYVSKSERRMLGLGKPKVGSIWPYGGGKRAAR